MRAFLVALLFLAPTAFAAGSERTVDLAIDGAFLDGTAARAFRLELSAVLVAEDAALGTARAFRPGPAEATLVVDGVTRSFDVFVSGGGPTPGEGRVLTLVIASPAFEDGEMLRADVRLAGADAALAGQASVTLVHESGGSALGSGVATATVG